MDNKQKIVTLYQIRQIVSDCHFKILQLSLSSSEDTFPYPTLVGSSEDALFRLDILLSEIDKLIREAYEQFNEEK